MQQLKKLFIFFQIGEVGFVRIIIMVAYFGASAVIGVNSKSKGINIFAAIYSIKWV